MTMRESLSQSGAGSGRASSLIYDPTVRGIVFQAVLVISVVLFIWWVTGNVIDNLRAANIASGFDFLWNRAGYEIAQAPISYSIDDTHGRAFLVSLLNTLIVAVLGIIFATILGFLVGIARLSPNWLLAKVATVYVEVFRNIPLLLQLLFWYKAVLAVLPAPRQGLQLPFGTNLSNRGLIIPWAEPLPGFSVVVGAIVAGLAGAYLIRRWANARQMATGETFPAFWAGVGLVAVLTVLAYLIAGQPLSWHFPELKGFNFVGGLALKPELIALLMGLSIYTASFIAEVVRAGILAVSHGQTEAGRALGVRDSRIMRLIVVPQAMRVIIPPLTSQYLNLTKNSSLAVAVGYPDLVAVFAGSTLNITGRAVEVIFMTMGVYLTLSLATAAFMNWFNTRVALVER